MCRTLIEGDGGLRPGRDGGLDILSHSGEKVHEAFHREGSFRG